ncbi:hypothetical protein ISCGN_010414 [Ixodes scapularis]
MQRWVLPRSQICLLRQSLQFRLLRPSLLLRVLYRGLYRGLFLELFLELSLGLPLFLGALLLFPRGISGLSGLFLRPRSGLSLSLVPVLFRRSGLFLGLWLLLLRTLCQGHHQSPWLQSNYLSPIWQFAQTHGQNCSFCRRQKRVHLWSLRERGAPVKAGVWRVESPRTPSPAGGACALSACPPQPHLEWYKPLPSLTEGRILVRQGPPKRRGVDPLRPLKPSCLEVGEFARKLGEPSGSQARKDQPAATPGELMDENRSKSDEGRPHSSLESLLSASGGTTGRPKDTAKKKKMLPASK